MPASKQLMDWSYMYNRKTRSSCYFVSSLKLLVPGSLTHLTKARWAIITKFANQFSVSADSRNSSTAIS